MLRSTSKRGSVRPSVGPSVRPSVRPSVGPSVHPSFRPCVCVRPSMRPSVCASIHPPVRPSVCPPGCPGTWECGNRKYECVCPLVEYPPNACSSSPGSGCVFASGSVGQSVGQWASQLVSGPASWSVDPSVGQWTSQLVSGPVSAMCCQSVGLLGVSGLCPRVAYGHSVVLVCPVLWV